MVCDVTKVVSRSDLRSRSDADLLAAVGVAEDGSEAFGEFYRRYEDAVLGYLRRRVSGPELAADLAAETFAAAIEAAPRFRVSASVDGRALGWLLTIAHNKLLTSLRRGRVADEARRRLALTEPLVLVDHALERVDELASLPEQLGTLVADLPAAQREALLARVVDERPYPEIAAELRCSELVVRQRVSRALSRLRRRLPVETS